MSNLTEIADLPDFKLYVAEFGKVSLPLFLIATNFDEALSDARAFELNGIRVTSLNEVFGKLHIDFDRELKRINTAIGKDK